MQEQEWIKAPATPPGRQEAEKLPAQELARSGAEENVGQKKVM